ncbi:MAG: phosphoribosylformylglycinamidine cyclo-ligase [Candidatus Thorarchaeota archaeon]|nr:phosphoribosylformylglycinamidine cyclo-ligase [Candidatus Thorarchaeota archaeon]
MVQVLVVAGSKSDESVVTKTTDVLRELGVTFTVEYASAHREPEKVRAIVEAAEARVIIAIAGLAAALPGVVAAYTNKPVIGVPVSSALGGLDALLSIVQMPKGTPVATVGIDNGQNAAYLAARIIGVEHKEPAKKTAIPHTYAQAGVDEEIVSAGLEMISKFVRESFKGCNVTQDFGHYANTVKISDDLCIALTTDGVGSKVLVAQAADRYDTIGQDCVAMNVNDLICIGATPVGFVDYLAVARPLPQRILEQIGTGLLAGCQECGIPILGGETAVMPEIIKGVGEDVFDLAGTAVGVVKPSEIIDGRAVEPGDIMLGVASNGLHSNGYTLARKVLLPKTRLDEMMPWGVTLGHEMLKPTRIYVKHFKALKEAGVDVHGIAHITGTGFRKILRLKKARFHITALPETPPIFETILLEGRVSWADMYSTFNMGVGLVVVVPKKERDRAIDILSKLDPTMEIGKVEEAQKASVYIEPHGVVIS